MPVVEAREPITRFRWTSTDRDAVADYLRANYTDFQPTCVPSEGFVFWTRGASITSLSMARLRHSGPVHTRADPPSSLVVVQTLAGEPHYIDDGRHTTRGTLKLTPTWSAFDTGWDDVTVQTVTLDHDAVARTAADLTGLEPEAVAFTSAAPTSDALAEYWCRLTAHVFDDVLGFDALMASPLVRASTLRQLATALLATFPNTALDALTDPHARDGHGGEPATVRRAVEFMDAHAHEDLGLTDIAEASRIGTRSLQIAFRRHRDITPLEYLRRVRLDNAHRDLQAADPTRGDRVETIAARWGFGHPGRFSVLYRQHYGRSPSATLRH